jgi:hypothetical protein
MEPDAMTVKPRLLAAAVMLLTILVSACSDSQKKSDSNRQMVVSSTGKFSQGYADGQRDAKWSLTDFSGADMWLWMAEKEYQDGYRQGWKNGRSATELESQQKAHEIEPRPAPRKVEEPQPEPSDKDSGG